MDIGILSILPQHAHPDEEEEEQAVGWKYGRGTPSGREEADGFSWFQALTLGLRSFGGEMNVLFSTFLGGAGLSGQRPEKSLSHSLLDSFHSTD